MGDTCSGLGGGSEKCLDQLGRVGEKGNQRNRGGRGGSSSDGPGAKLEPCTCGELKVHWG